MIAQDSNLILRKYLQKKTSMLFMCRFIYMVFLDRSASGTDGNWKEVSIIILHLLIRSNNYIPLHVLKDLHRLIKDMYLLTP